MSIRFRGIEVASVRDGSVQYPLGEPLDKIVAELDVVDVTEALTPLPALTRNVAWSPISSDKSGNCCRPSIGNTFIRKYLALLEKNVTLSICWR
jgi:hypothetical protein